MATWLEQLGNWNTNATAGIFGGADASGAIQQASGFGKAMGGLGINASNIGGIANTIGQIGTGLLAGQNQTSIGNAMQTIGGLASNIPGVGGLIGAGVGILGGLTNVAFGSHINKEFVADTERQANTLGNRVFNAGTNSDLLNDWQNVITQSNVNKSEVGSDGWFSHKASRQTRRLNEAIDNANNSLLNNFNIAAQNVDAQNDLRILQNIAAYGGPIESFRRFYTDGGGLFSAPKFPMSDTKIHAKGGYLNQAKALIRQNEGWSAKPYTDSPKGKNWRSVGYGFNDSGFRDKYPEGISKHYEHGITKKQAEEELDYFLNKAEKQLKSIYGKQWNDFNDSQKAAILDTYYQRPASVGKSSRFYKAVTAGEDAGKYLGVAGFSKRNNTRQNVFSGGKSIGQEYAEVDNSEDSLTYPSPILEVTSPVFDLDLTGIEPSKVVSPKINLDSPSLDLSFITGSEKPEQTSIPTVGTVEDFLASYGDFEQNLFGSRLNNEDMNIFDFGGGLTHGADWDTGLDFVSEGGSHGENPFGGVMVGQDEEGVPNLVEEGEYIWNNDYVFSRRMKVPKQLREKYHLSDDATFADAVKKLTKESEERPLDAISRNTQDHILGELADSQEEMRVSKAQRKMEKEQQLQDDFLTGVQFGLGGALFADGGGIHIDPSKKGTFKAQASKMGMGVQEAASHILANKDDYSPAMVKKAVFARNSKSWNHADGGSLFTAPFDFNVLEDGGSKRRGQVVPFAYDWYRSGSDGYSTPTGFKVGSNGKAFDYTKEYIDLINKLGANDIRKWAAEHPNDTSLKSFLAKGNKLEDLTDEQWRKGATDGKYGFMHHVADNMLNEKVATRGFDMPNGNIRWTPDPTVIENPQISKLPTSATTNGTEQRSSFRPKQTWTRNLPWIMSGIMGLKEMLTPADYGNADSLMEAAYQAGSPVSIGTEYLGDYRKRDPFDERYLMNLINQRGAATNRNMMNLSGGNRAAAMAGILSNDLTTQMSLAEAARQSYLANRADDAQVAEFNRGTNQFNATAQNQRNQFLAGLNSQRQQAMLSGISQGARLRQAIKDQRDAAISANLSAFAQGLGDLGKENGFYNMLGGLNNEGILKYFYGDNWNTKFND